MSVALIVLALVAQLNQSARSAPPVDSALSIEALVERFKSEKVLFQQAVPILVSLLKDPEVTSTVPWALGQIGDKRAIGPLLNALDDDSPSMRVLAIYALETLKAKEALPRLISLLDDHRRSNFGAQVRVADAARTTVDKLKIGLGGELLARNLPVPRDAVDLDRPITSYSVLDDSQGFVIAYYMQEPDNALHELRVRSFDKRTRTWRSRTFAQPIGSILEVQRHAGYLYIKGHSSPSATPLLVLSESLERKRELDGWPMLMLDDGRVVFHRSTVHFAPAHAGALALYDPASDRVDPLYPPATVPNERGIENVPGTDLLLDRSISGLKKGSAPGTIEFGAVEQPVRVNRDNRGEAAGPERRLRVVCRVAVSPVVCAPGISE